MYYCNIIICKIVILLIFSSLEDMVGSYFPVEVEALFVRK